MATTDTPTTSTPTSSYPRTVVRIARGGISGGAILTGVVVALGATSLLSAMLAGLVIATGLTDDVFPGDEVQGGLVLGVLFVVMQFLAYLWGGYTAGRMSRGIGWANGLLVPLVAILLLLLVGAVVTVLSTATVGLSVPIHVTRMTVAGEAVVTWPLAIGIASLVAMFGGGALGGSLGTRWHTRLERDAVVDETPSPTQAT